MDELAIVLLKFLAIVLLVLANGFFVAVEFALVSVRRSRLDHLIAQGKTAAKVVVLLLERTDRILAAAQLGITLASLALGWIGESTIAERLYPLLDSLPVVVALGLTHTIATVLALTLLTALHIVLGEQTPKIFAIRRPEQVSILTARAIIIFELIFRPFIWLLDRASQLTLRLIGVRGHKTEPGHMHSLEDLRALFVDVQQRGLLNEQQEEMLHSVIEFTEMEAKDVMTPRPELVSLEESQPLSQAIELIKESGYSRFPVYRERPENVIGFITVKDVLKILSDQPEAGAKPVRSIATPIKYVPANQPVSRLFHELQRKRVPMVAVVNEFSDTEGIVTMNGLAEEIVGKLEDVSESEPLFERIDRNTIRVDGQMRVNEANEGLDLKLPEHDEYQTLAGFILFQLQRVPKVGDSLKYGQILLTVDRMDGPRIDKVLIRGV